MNIFEDLEDLAEQVQAYYALVNAGPDPTALAVATGQLGEAMNSLGSALVRTAISMAMEANPAQSDPEDSLH